MEVPLKPPLNREGGDKGSLEEGAKVVNQVQRHPFNPGRQWQCIRDVTGLGTSSFFGTESP